jgi:pimeloyl-ACP methyl ester carboxylesterase
MSQTPTRILSAVFIVLAALALAVGGPRSVAPGTGSAHYAFGHGPTLVMVHGLGSQSAHWFPTARLLAHHWRVVLVDLPGHGDTDMPDPFSLDRAEYALDRAIADEGGGPVVLVGHSLGGLVAAAEAIDHPERVRRLVLIETALRPQVDAAQRAVLLQALDGDYDHVLRSAYAEFGRDSAQGVALYQEVRGLDPAHIKPWIRLALSADLSESAANLRMPVLAVLAERSWAKGESWPPTAQVLGYSHIPHLTHERIEGCGHFVMLDRPATLAALINRFGLENGGPLATR